MYYQRCQKLSALGQNLPDNLIAALLLGSLPQSYDTLVTALESRPEKDITYQFIKGKLIDEYKRRKGAKDIRNNFQSNETAMKSVHKNGTKSSTHFKKSCFFCKKAGHLKPDCFKYKAWKSKQEKANKATEEVFNESLFMVKENSKCTPSIKVKEKACVSFKAEDRENTWFIDSGATSHMTISQEFFINFDPDITGYVELAEPDKKSEVQGKGSGTIKCIVGDQHSNLKIRNVLYVPTLGSNLLSVKKLTADGYEVNFEENKCRILRNGKVKAVANIGPYAQDLYELKAVEKERAHVAVKTGHSESCQHTWHRRFGHRDPSAIKELIEKNLAVGIKIKDCKRQDEICECCVKGKMYRQPFPKESQNKTTAILDLLHTDVCGPMQTITPGGKRYVMTIIDDYSRYTTVYFLQTKDEAAKYIKEFIKLARTQYNKIPKCIRSDRGREYVNADLQNYLRKKGIKIQYTAAYSPQQNGVAERKNRSLIEMARCMLLDANLNKKYWAEAVNTANFLQNRLPTRSTGKTPYELWYFKKPDVKNLHIFGCDAYVQIPKELRKKLDDKAEKLTFIGYSEESKAFRLLDKKTEKIKISRDVIFLEQGHQVFQNKDHEELTFRRDKVTEDEMSEINNENNASNTEFDSHAIQEIDVQKILPVEPQINARRSERSNRGVPPNRYTAAKGIALLVNDPKSIKEALSSPERDRWKEAMEEEINSLVNNKTWDIVPAPEGRDVITCKWVFKTKRNEQGQVERYKARLVARGFSQKYGTDYDEVFVPVVRQTTFKILLAIADNSNLIIKHFDTKTAFLNENLET